MRGCEVIMKIVSLSNVYILSIHVMIFSDLRGNDIENGRRLIARKSPLEKTQLSDVLITDNLF